VVRITWYVLGKGCELGMKRGWHEVGAGTAIVAKKKEVGSLPRKLFFYPSTLVMMMTFMGIP
jgi:hypothetical protein